MSHPSPYDVEVLKARAAEFKRVGHTGGSDPFSADRDERAFCLLQSRHR